MIDEELSEESGWELSPSVRGARDKVGPNTQIAAGKLVAAVLEAVNGGDVSTPV